jgi:hypothetical protein
MESIPWSMECVASSAQGLPLPIPVSVQSFGVFIGNTSAHLRHNFVRVICRVHAAARAGRSEMRVSPQAQGARATF